ncbi:hypothetical protein Tco_0738788 [Tanacetum coccineum]
MVWEMVGSLKCALIALIELERTVVERTVQDRTVRLELVSPRLFCSGLKLYHLPPASSAVSEQDVPPSSVGLDFRARLDGGQMARSSNNAQDSSALRSRSLPPTDWSMDIVAEFCGPSRWKELSKESGSKILPCGDGSCWKTFKPIASLIA